MVAIDGAAGCERGHREKWLCRRVSEGQLAHVSSAPSVSLYRWLSERARATLAAPMHAALATYCHVVGLLQAEGTKLPFVSIK